MPPCLLCPVVRYIVSSGKWEWFQVKSYIFFIFVTEIWEKISSHQAYQGCSPSSDSWQLPMPNMPQKVWSEWRTLIDSNFFNFCNFLFFCHMYAFIDRSKSLLQVKNYMVRHFKTHEKKTLPCEECGQQISSKASLKAHIKNKHKKKSHEVMTQCLDKFHDLQIESFKISPIWPSCQHIEDDYWQTYILLDC